MTTAVKKTAGMLLPAIVEHSLRKNADHMQQVMAFHSMYGAPMHPLTNDDPEFSHMDNERVGLRLGLISEEFAELFEKGFGVEEVEITYKVADGSRQQQYNDHAMRTGKLQFPKRDGAEVADALGDLIYVIYGFALEMGYDMRAVVEEIHASNMTKLDADGMPIIADGSDPKFPKGKVLKGPDYMEPNIPAALKWGDSE